MTEEMVYIGSAQLFEVKFPLHQTPSPTCLQYLIEVRELCVNYGFQKTCEIWANFGPIFAPFNMSHFKHSAPSNILVMEDCIQSN